MKPMVQAHESAKAPFMVLELAVLVPSVWHASLVEELDRRHCPESQVHEEQALFNGTVINCVITRVLGRCRGAIWGKLSNCDSRGALRDCMNWEALWAHVSGARLSHSNAEALREAAPARSVSCRRRCASGLPATGVADRQQIYGVCRRSAPPIDPARFIHEAA
jgi:hypothetical protein